MKAKTTSIMILTFLLANMFAGALTFSATMVSAQNGIVVGASLGRYRIYDEEDVFVDSVSGVLNGYLRSRYDISPGGNVEIENASIVLETPFAPGNFTNTSWDPEGNYTFEFDEVSGNWTYAWDFDTLPSGQGAMVSLPTNFQVDFDPGFDCQRIWNPWITSEFVTQTLTIVFTPSLAFSNFHNVHVSVQIPNTPEVAPTIDPDSISSSPPKDERLLNWTTWWDVTNGHVEVNWGGDPERGVTYTFSVDVTVVNELFPEPIFYKPSAGFGANFAASFSVPDIPYPKIGDDINRDGNVESSVTYNGTGAFTWEESAQSEHAVSLPWFSSVVPFMAEGIAFVKLEDGFLRGSAFLVSGPTPPIPKYVYLNVDGHGFWWETTELSVLGNMIRLKCEPATVAPGNPGPAPIVVRISRPEEGRRVTASGSGVSFTGQITEIITPP